MISSNAGIILSLDLVMCKSLSVQNGYHIHAFIASATILIVRALAITLTNTTTTTHLPSLLNPPVRRLLPHHPLTRTIIQNVHRHSLAPLLQNLSTVKMNTRCSKKCRRPRRKLSEVKGGLRERRPDQFGRRKGQRLELRARRERQVKSTDCLS